MLVTAPPPRIPEGTGMGTLVHSEGQVIVISVSRVCPNHPAVGQGKASPFDGALPLLVGLDYEILNVRYFSATSSLFF